MALPYKKTTSIGMFSKEMSTALTQHTGITHDGHSIANNDIIQGRERAAVCGPPYGGQLAFLYN